MQSSARNPWNKVLFPVLFFLVFVCAGKGFAFSVRAGKSVYSPGEPIAVHFSGFVTETDWITIVPADAPDDHYDEWYYTHGEPFGVLTFKGLSPGTYEVRAYCCWQPGRPGHGGYNVQARYRFTVGQAQQGRTERSPARIPGRVCRQLRPGDPYYDGWVSCCDVGNGRSRWVKRSSGEAKDYRGTCNYWGIY